jgi:hypothetical protein
LCLSHTDATQIDVYSLTKVNFAQLE